MCKQTNITFKPKCIQLFAHIIDGRVMETKTQFSRQLTEYGGITSSDTQPRKVIVILL